jgi:alpha-ketoglutarate-dependent taurine dioxygenase
MSLVITSSGQACGAEVSGIDLSRPLSPARVDELRSAWLAHKVLSFPGQSLDDDDLERFTGYFGGFGEDPFIAPVPGRQHIIAVQRRAGEKAPLFAENWHTDWSFQARPPAGTCLYGIEIPPRGGDTLFIDQERALAAMPPALRARIEGRQAIHSARGGYAPAGLYGEKDQASDRSMDIRPSDTALATQTHPLVRRHRETGAEVIFGCIGYIIGIEGLPEAEAMELLLALYEWQTREEFQYRHRWQRGTLLMWDNRALLHCATGGYEGYDRLLHRTTIADDFQRGAGPGHR